MDFLKYPELLLSPRGGRGRSLSGSGSWVRSASMHSAHLIMVRVFSNQGISPAHANFGWFIPPVLQMIIPVAGFELAELFPHYLELTFGLSIGVFRRRFVFLFLFVGSVVFHRYIYHELPMSRLAADDVHRDGPHGHHRHDSLQNDASLRVIRMCWWIPPQLFSPPGEDRYPLLLGVILRLVVCDFLYPDPALSEKNRTALCVEPAGLHFLRRAHSASPLPLPGRSPGLHRSFISTFWRPSS